MLQVHAIGAAPRAVRHLRERYPHCCGVLVPLGRAVSYVAALTVMSHGLLSDLLLGLALQLPLLLRAGGRKRPSPPGLLPARLFCHGAPFLPPRGAKGRSRSCTTKRGGCCSLGAYRSLARRA